MAEPGEINQCFNTSVCTYRDFHYFISLIRERVCMKDNNGNYIAYHGRKMVKHPDDAENNIKLEFISEYENGRGAVRRNLTLIMRGADLYIIGFENQHGLFRFKGETLDRSSPLPFEGTYQDLQKKGKSLDNVQFGISAIRSSVYTLTSGARNVRDGASAVITLVLNIAESVRYNHIRNHVCSNFVFNRVGVMTDLIETLVKNWSKISRILVAAVTLGDDNIVGLGFSLRTARGYIKVLKYVGENDEEDV